jgi:CBS domain-containing protein
MRVSNILKRKGGDVASVSPATTVRDAAAMLAKHRIGSVLVREKERIAGILSERDIVRALSVSGGDCLDQPVADLMTADVITCSPDDSPRDVLRLMTERRIRHVPVLDAAGKLAGLVSIGDVVKYRLEEAQAEAKALEDYVKGG